MFNTTRPATQSGMCVLGRIASPCKEQQFQLGSETLASDLLQGKMATVTTGSPHLDISNLRLLPLSILTLATAITAYVNTRPDDRLIRPCFPMNIPYCQTPQLPGNNLMRGVYRHRTVCDLVTHRSPHRILEPSHTMTTERLSILLQPLITCPLPPLLTPQIGTILWVRYQILHVQACRLSKGIPLSLLARQALQNFIDYLGRNVGV